MASGLLVPRSSLIAERRHTERTRSRVRSVLALLGGAFLLAPSLIGLDIATADPATADVTEEQIGQGGAFPTTREHRVAPGLDLTTLSRLEEGGWNNGNVLTADLTEPTLSMDVVDTGEVASVAPLDELIHAGADGDRAVAAVNGTFFDMDKSGAPVYTSVSSDGVRMGDAQERPALTLADGQAAIQALSASGELTLADGTVHDLTGMNEPELENDEIGVYTAAWGSKSLDRVLKQGDDAPADSAARATVVDGQVTDVAIIEDGKAGELEVPDGGQVLLGRDSGAAVIADLTVGDEVEVAFGPDQDVDMGIAGSTQVLEDGAVPQLDEDDELVTGLHARTAVGLSKDGTELYVLVLDGKTTDSHGMTLPELGQIMADMGAHNAINLDGGGSSALAARVAGANSDRVWNSPSDGKVRDVANALVFSSSADPEELSDVQADLLLDDQDAVFPGLTRTIRGTGLGANLDPVLTDGEFTTDGGVEVVDADSQHAVVQANGRGPATVTFAADGFEDGQDLRVLGDPIGLRPNSRTVNIADPDSPAEVTLTGFDADGRSARIETRDAEVTVSDGFEVQDDVIGTWTVSATGDVETGTLTMRVGDLETTIALTSGTDETNLLDFSDLSAFTGGADRATGDLSAADGPEGEDGSTDPAIGLRYDFTTSTATRGFYLIPDEPVAVEGDTLEFTLDVRGDGNGSWPRLQITDGNGTVTNLDGDLLEFEGWQQVHFTVPDGLAQPLTVERIRMMETRPEAQYQGDIAVANLHAVTAPAAETPQEQTVHDPALLTTGSVDDRPQRIAVMSDAQFIAADPDSANAEGARRTLREIRAQDPDLLVINGDFVDEAAPEDFELAQQILDEEWDPSIPYVYVPGNHEVMGGEITNFEDAFGAVNQETTLGSTRVITLNTSAGTLAGGGIDQIEHLQDELDAAAESDDLTGVVVFFHHPTQDPLPDKNSQLTDQREARALEDTLAEFRRSSGKSVAMVNGHVGVFHGAAIEGVTSLINGNSGKGPHGTPATGGFIGWTMLGIDPDSGVVGTDPVPQDRVDWLAAETHPWVEDLTPEASGELTVGQTGEVSAILTQDDTEVPVAWPVTSRWGGSGVQVETGGAGGARVAAGGEMTEEADDSAVVRVNPVTGEITGLRAGTAEVEVTVMGVSTQQTVTVHGEGEEPGDGDDGDDGGSGDGDDGDEEPGDGDDGDGSETPTPPGQDGDGSSDDDPAGPDSGSADPDGGDPSAPADDTTTGEKTSRAPGSLSRTGADAAPLLVAAGVLIVAGATLLLVRRSHHRS
jgi:3',5'-cyclic AMP phosphodiesterase CpdA